MTQSIIHTLESVRTQSPLVHNITNYVVMNNTANALLAIGASPVMAHAIEEVCDLVDICASLVINIGTLSSSWIESMEIAVRRAGEMGKPIVIDPVGAGATVFRTEVVHKLTQCATPAVIRGNASEIMSLMDADVITKGVDSLEDSDNACGAARALAQQLGCVVCVSGATDYVTDGNSLLTVRNGHELMTKVTGMGCTASAIIGACVGVNNNYLDAAWSAMAIMGVAGDMAAMAAQGPGSMQWQHLDSLYTLKSEDIAIRFKA